MEIEVLLDTEDGSVTQCCLKYICQFCIAAEPPERREWHLVNVEECIANRQIRQDHEINLPQQLPQFPRVCLFMEIRRVVKQRHGRVAIGRLVCVPFCRIVLYSFIVDEAGSFCVFDFGI